MNLRRILAPVLLAIAVLAPLSAAAPAGAAPTVSIVGDGNVTQSSTVTLHYSGVTQYEKLLIQQCVKGDEAGYDWSLWCPGDTTRVTPLLDKVDGTLTFDVFVGDEPSYSFPYACGPTLSPGVTSYDTCYIRVVQSDIGDTNSDVFVPITFRGAAPVPTTVARAVPTSIAAAPTTVAPAAAATGPSTTPPGRAVVTIHAPRRRNGPLGLALWALVALVLGALGSLAVARFGRARRHRRTAAGEVGG